MIYKRLLVFATALLFTSIPVKNMFSQISEGGVPPSFDAGFSKESYDIRSMEKPDLDALQREDWENAQLGYPKPDRMGVSVMVGLTPGNAGTWTDLPDGSRVWRLGIHVPDALALGVYYDHFYLPAGGRLYLYNRDRTQVIGAFTAQNNHETGLFATEFIQGDEVTLEYHQAAGVTEKAIMSISEVAYAYRDISFRMDGQLRGGSWPCMINVVCEEGEGWEDQIRGVARMSIKIGWGYYWCSGSLINNTNHNRVPYFLSAEHCGEGASVADRNQWIFYFNYQANTCSGTWGSSSNTVTGCALKARDPLTSYDGADFELMQLNSTPPSSYNVYYNGWNRANVPAENGVGIHHPAGDIKKISTYDDMVSSTWWNGTPTHWRITWAATVNGLSVMQGGSSGSPVFDQDGLIMGDLSGGYETNSCSNPSPAWYGKVWYAWDQNGTTAATRLKDWLDPTNTGAMTIPGLNAAVLPPVADFTADNTDVTQGDTIRFFDSTTGNPALTWEWSFPGGDPETSTEQHPVVVYITAGTFDVTLEVTNADGSNTEVKQEFVTVAEVLTPETDFSADVIEITEGESVNFTDLTLNNPNTWTWIFQGGDPATSTVQHPENITYAEPGTYNVVLTTGNFAGSDSELKEDYILVNPGLAPVADFYADNIEIMAGDTVNFFDLSINNPNQWLWTFEGGTPAGSSIQNPTGIVYNEEGTFNVSMRARNSFGSHTTVKEDYIVVGPVSVKDLGMERSMLVYPNPSSGRVNVRLAEHAGSVRTLALFNALGEKLLEARPIDGRAGFDLGGYPEGLYFIRAEAGGKLISAKVSITR